MNWTSTPPTTPGFYAWKPSEESKVYGALVVTDSMGGIAVTVTGMWGNWLKTPTEIGGLWSRLVPADEIEKAWVESYDDVIGMKGTALPTDRWLKSRAKRVMEGLV